MGEERSQNFRERGTTKGTIFVLAEAKTRRNAGVQDISIRVQHKVMDLVHSLQRIERHGAFTEPLPCGQLAECSLLVVLSCVLSPTISEADVSK